MKTHTKPSQTAAQQAQSLFDELVDFADLQLEANSEPDDVEDVAELALVRTLPRQSRELRVAFMVEEIGAACGEGTYLALFVMLLMLRDRTWPLFVDGAAELRRRLFDEQYQQLQLGLALERVAAARGLPAETVEGALELTRKGRLN